MVVNQPHHILPQSLGGVEPGENFLGHLGAHLSVALEVPPAGFVLGEAGRLAHIVQEGCPAQQARQRRRCRRHMADMGVDIVGVVGGVLQKPQGGGQLRNGGGENGGKPEQILLLRCRQKAGKLLENPLPGEPLHQGGVGHHGPHGGFLHRQAEPGGEADAPENPQSILLKAPVGLPHTAQDAPAQILLPPEGVGVAPHRGPSNGVDGKVPAGQIRLDIRHEFHPAGVAAVVVAPLGAEGGNLCHPPGEPQTHGAVADAHRVLLHVPENCLGFLRLGGGGNVVVIGWLVQQCVPDASTHQVGGIARLLQGGENPLCLGRREHLSSPPGAARHRCPPATRRRW